ncbi:hypothetical protein CAPTEDRAFT_165086 [Capitella teleta]|uniref:Copper transport protein n=1 Tax=Capitella teleta TaxID=283909 RepID=R7TDX1_CAPTE|nr:hypothetical protein CAPTEDRAFT_165086 [Capitella teleta]|eukprot:ELT91953.1 hypothetical protein CAPTEDRAFT_165086 [Capitella teleta]
MSNYSAMDHSTMDHGSMDHGSMDHGSMDHNDVVMVDNGHDEHSTSGMDHMGMKMYFHFGCEELILFNGWRTTSWQGMLGSCVAVFVMAALYEGLKVGREMLLRSSITTKYSVSVPGEETQAMTEQREMRTPPPILSCAHALQTLLHILQLVISYFLMLIFMTYNAWLCISVALGAGLGYFAFGWRRALIVDINEHCH